MLHAKPNDKVIVVGNGFKVPNVSLGTIRIQDPNDNMLIIDNERFAPYFTKNIISIRVLLENGWKVSTASPTKISMISNLHAAISFDMDPLDKLYYFRGHRISRKYESVTVAMTKTMDINVLHGILDHADFTTCKLMTHSMKTNLSRSRMHCGACALAKAKAKAVP